ncbi:hypothetical protein B0J11DRAFT_210653 [Dendryphion nanum]|uniref:dolichol kinase n=1 Tax=Dendryphion nanum TaxID=256645 RepID=A0A9P9ISR7_9PLEO|nr:hypothetical protein B0J11DRAFT_210653 [Dendryphion nanum]
MPHDSDAPVAQLNTVPSAEIEALELFRRSPHPYHRRRHELKNGQASASASSSSNDISRTSLAPSDHTISDDDGRKRRKTSASPSESGTEADDEGYGFIKALPAPPLRPRKGLRDVRGSGLDDGVSPLLTPSQVDEEGRKYSADYFKNKKEGARTGEPSPTDDEAKAARQKYLKRRRAEIVRRATEAALLGTIGILAVRGCCCWGNLLQWHRVELLTHVLVMVGVLALYPLRLFLYSTTREPPSNRRLRQRIRIPAAFDPAPILYPAVVPALISISLYSSFPRILLPNLLLGLAALPPQLVPFGNTNLGYSTIHWFLSVLPLIASENTELPSKLFAPKPYKLKLPPPEEGLHPELLVTLFALHQALLPPLYYLTTTSLLPAELHLLSIGLINMLLFADSPQMNILKTLLWLGGVGLFVLCGKVLKWGVALARIPRWRFRRAGQIIKARQTFLQTLNESLRPQRSHSATGGAVSDSDADDSPLAAMASLKKTKSLKLNILDSVRNGSLLPHGNETQSAVEPKHGNFEDHQHGSDWTSFPQRRNTLPSLPSPNHHATQHHTHRRRSKSIAQSFLALTPNEASLRKYIYAAYFYLVVLLVIIGPVRFIISKAALHTYEPFGWALGYLFGNLPPFRFQVMNYDLYWWIPLPPLPDNPIPPLTTIITLFPSMSLITSTIGPANTRLLLIAHCIVILLIGLATVLRLSTIVEVDTRRKVFHGMMVAMLLPTIFIDPCFVSLALALVLAIFLLLDLIRASQLPPLSRPLAAFLTPYVDGRDLRGPVVVSHIFLLIGCAIPLWLSMAGVTRTGFEPWSSWDVSKRDVSMIAGVVCVGMGDAAASLIGRRYGRRKWPWAGGKSLEGSAAFAIAVTIGLVAGKAWLRAGGWEEADRSAVSLEGLIEWTSIVSKAGICAMGASLNEAVLTGGNDNVVVPVVLWLLVRGVKL